jgi:transcriptional regulator with XRE-family HTH domain
MLSEKLGEVLHHARKLQKLSREALARRAGVSTRLVAELERGERPNVSLESALKLLGHVGVSVVVHAPDGAAAHVRDSRSARVERAARAIVRRRLWTGARVHAHRAGQAPPGGDSAPDRLAAVSQVSNQAFGLAKRSTRRS